MAEWSDTANMKIVFENPPMFDEIDRAFNVRGKDVLFCWGRTIYSPISRSIHPSIIDHESVHARQQGANEDEIVAWWRMYIAEPTFRLACEIPAHKVEYEWYSEKPRNERRYALTFIAKKLAAPLYGNLISVERAKRALAGKADIPGTARNQLWALKSATLSTVNTDVD